MGKILTAIVLVIFWYGYSESDTDPNQEFKEKLQTLLDLHAKDIKIQQKQIQSLKKYIVLLKESQCVENDIPLDTKDPLYKEYFKSVKVKITKEWVYPRQAVKKGFNGKVEARFKIARDGRILSVNVIDTSGYKLLDDAAIDAIRKAAPFTPFPEFIKKKSLSIRVTFIYSPEYGGLKK